MDNRIDNLAVNITSARITSLVFTGLDNEGLPDVSASVQLLSSSGKPITTINISTSTYSKGPGWLHPDDIPVEIYSKLGSILAAMKAPLLRNINSVETLLEYKPE